MTARALDPFESFDRHQGIGAIEDPHPRWAQWRESSPVHRVRTAELLNIPITPPGMSEDLFVALSFDAVVDVLRDPASFSSSGYARTMGLVMGPSILQMDEPEHGRHRALLSQAFSRRAVADWERQVVQPLVREHVDALRSGGRADLIRGLTFPVPVSIIAKMIGVPEEKTHEFHRMAVELISIAFDPAAGMRASQELRELFEDLLDARRSQPRGDLLSLLAAAQRAPDGPGDEEIFGFLRLLAPAGAETTYRSSSNLLCALLSDAEAWEAVKRDRALLAPAIEEGLRWEPPITQIMRTASCDTTVCGVEIPKGSSVWVNLAAANRDPTRWTDPDRFDLQREARRHASFAFGPHTCLGMHLARVETRALVEGVMDGLPGLRLDPDAARPRVSGVMFRSPQSLPVVFDG